jgi:drug/metabolite transporter (DMT)-like permease
VAAFGFGTLGVISRFVAEAGVGVLAFVAWRSVISAAVIVPIVAGMARAGRLGMTPWRGLSRLDRVQLASLAVLNVLINVAIFAAFAQASIAVVLISFYAYPVIVAVAGVRIYREPLDGVRLMALLLASAGMLLVVAGPTIGESGHAIAPAGVALGLVAAVLQAVYALVAGRGFAAVPAMQASAGIGAMTALLSVGVVALGGSAASLAEPLSSPGAWPWLLVAGTLGAAIPAVAVLAGYRRVGPTRASILMLLEPVIGATLAALVLAERPAPVQAVGGMLVLAAVAILQLGVHRQRSRVQGPPAM